MAEPAAEQPVQMGFDWMDEAFDSDSPEEPAGEFPLTTSPAHPAPRPVLRLVSSALPPELQESLRGSLRGKLCSARALGERHHASTAPPFASTLPVFDQLLSGGLPRGQLVELVSQRSSGSFAAILRLLAAATEVGETAALVDLGDALAPRAAENAGVVLERLLWVRPRRLKQALRAAELLLATGFPLVVLDLGPPPLPGGRGAEAFWLRLARAARARQAALLVVSPYRVSGTAAEVVLRLRRGRSFWHGRGLAPRLLMGREGWLDLEKHRDQPEQVPRQGGRLRLPHPLVLFPELAEGWGETEAPPCEPPAAGVPAASPRRRATG